MYPIHPKLAMDIAVSSGIAERRQEWPDDPNGTPNRTIEPMSQDPIFMAIRSARTRIGQSLSRLLARTSDDSASTPVAAGRVLPIGERSSDSDRAKAA